MSPLHRHGPTQSGTLPNPRIECHHLARGMMAETSAAREIVNCPGLTESLQLRA
jgi:hypothetical protein